MRSILYPKYQAVAWVFFLGFQQAAFCQIKILEALYGSNGQIADVTAVVQKAVNEGASEIYVGNHTMGTDPAPGKTKSLRIAYRGSSGLKELEINEGDKFKFESESSVSGGQASSAENADKSMDKQDVQSASNGTSADSASSSLETSKKQDDDLPPEVLDAMVVVKGKEGSGSGFVCSINGKTYVVTNQHVISGLTNARFQTRGGVTLLPASWQLAKDVDLVIMEVKVVPTNVRPLELLGDLSKQVAQGDQVTIPGNSEGHGVVTQTHGELLAIGGQRIETDCPVYPGNSGSPIIHRKSGKVIGVLTEAERLIFDEFTKHSFKDKKSAIKSEVRYFGYRIDTVADWISTTANALNAERSLLDMSRRELDWIADYFTGASDSYKEFKELHTARNEAYKAYNTRDLAFSEIENARKRFLWRLNGLIARAVKRIPQRRLAYIHEEKAEAVKTLASNLATGVEIVERDDVLTVELIKRGL